MAAKAQTKFSTTIFKREKECDAINIHAIELLAVIDEYMFDYCRLLYDME